MVSYARDRARLQAKMAQRQAQADADLVAVKALHLGGDDDFEEWVKQHLALRAAFERVLELEGIADSGKTHALRLLAEARAELQAIKAATQLPLNPHWAIKSKEGAP